jgi:hypothetical protein
VVDNVITRLEEATNVLQEAAGNRAKNIEKVSGSV